MSNWYLRLVGRWVAGRSPSLYHFSDEHRSFLRAGYVCQACGETLMHPWGVEDIECYAADGTRLALVRARFGGDYFACPRCRHTWRVLDEQARRQRGLP